MYFLISLAIHAMLLGLLLIKVEVNQLDDYIQDAVTVELANISEITNIKTSIKKYDDKPFDEDSIKSARNEIEETLESEIPSQENDIKKEVELKPELIEELVQVEELDSKPKEPEHKPESEQKVIPIPIPTPVSDSKPKEPEHKPESEQAVVPVPTPTPVSATDSKPKEAEQKPKPEQAVVPVPTPTPVPLPATKVKPEIKSEKKISEKSAPITKPKPKNDSFDKLLNDLGQKSGAKKVSSIKDNQQKNKHKTGDIMDDLFKNLSQKSDGKNNNSKKISTKSGNDKINTRGSDDFNENEPLSSGEKELIKRKIQNNWRISQMNSNASKFKTMIHLKLNKDGSIQDLKVVSVNCPTGVNCQAMNQDVERAVIMSGPFDELSPDRYAAWSEFKLEFAPSL